MLKQITFVLSSRICNCAGKIAIQVGQRPEGAQFTFSCPSCGANYAAPIKKFVVKDIYLDELKGKTLAEAEQAEYIELCREIEEKVKE